MWNKNILKRRRILFAILPRLKNLEVPDLIFFPLIFTALLNLQYTVQNSDIDTCSRFRQLDYVRTAEENLRSETLEEGVNGTRKCVTKEQQ